MKLPTGKLSEKEVQKAVLNAFKGDTDIVLFRRNVGAHSVESKNGKSRYLQFGEAGQSDIWGIVNGRHIEIEVKAPKGKLSELQKNWLEFVKKSGGIAMVYQPKDVVDLFQCRKTILAEIDKQLTNPYKPSTMELPVNYVLKTAPKCSIFT